MKLRKVAIDRFFISNLSDYYLIPIVYLNDRGGIANTSEMSTLLGETLLESNMLNKIIEKGLIDFKNNFYYLTEKGRLNLYFHGLIEKPIINITSNIARNSRLLLIEMIKESSKIKTTIIVPRNESYEILSLVNAISGEIVNGGNSIIINEFNLDRIFYYSGLENYKFYFEIFDKLNLLSYYYDRFKEGMPFETIVEFKKRNKIRIDVYSHPHFDEFNYISHFPTKIRNFLSYLIFLGLIKQNQNSKMYSPTTRGTEVNSVILQKYISKELDSINRTNSLIAGINFNNFHTKTINN